MFAAVKIILTLVITCGSLIAVIAESTHPQFVACVYVAFAVGVIAAEAVRARRQRSVRWLPRRAGVRISLNFVRRNFALFPGRMRVASHPATQR
jgi:hypothetical protein